MPTRRRAHLDIPLRSYWQLLAEHVAPQKARFALMSALLLGGIGLQVVAPQVVRRFIDAAEAGASLEVLLAAALGYLGIAVIQQVVSVGAVYLGESVAWTATNSLRSSLMRHCLSLDMAFHHSTKPGELIERIDGDVTKLSRFFSTIFVQVFGNILLAAGIVVALAIEDWRLGAAFAAFSIVLLLSMNRVRDAGVPLHKALREAETRLFGFIEEHLGGTEDIRSSGAIGFVQRSLFHLQYVAMRCHLRSDIASETVRLVGNGLMAIGMAVGLVGSYFLHTAGVLTIGAVYLVVQYIHLLSTPVHELSWHLKGLQEVGGGVERLNELQSRRSRLKDCGSAAIPEGALEVSYDSVDFCYSDQEPVLRGVTFTMEPGAVLGLLGRTGSGKTTVARLALRLYDPTKGLVHLGQRDVREYRLADVRNRAAYVTQDVQLLQGSVRDNLTLFDPSTADDELIRAIRALSLQDWYDALPQGLDSPIAAGGRSMSAGEAQLLALTRAFHRDPGLVILDEASSRLDPATEQRVERAVDQLLAGRTAIVIAHRLRTVRRCDQILVLDGGRVVEFGGREELARDPESQFARLLATDLEEVLV